MLDGAKLSAEIFIGLREQTAALAQAGCIPGLGTILVGDDPASAAYIAAKHRACAECGVRSIHCHLPETSSQKDVMNAVHAFNSDPAVSAYLVQLPLPSGLNEEEVLLAVDPAKDADGLHPVNLGRLVMGTPGPIPCTPAGIQALLVHYGVPIEGKHVVVVGRGITIGRPIALLLSLKRPHCNAAVTVVHTGVKDISEYTRSADIIVAAAGSPSMIRPDMVRPGAAVVGAGITREGRRVVSDVDDAVATVAGWVTPRLGGVGPMTVAMLLKNTLEAAQQAVRT